MSNLNIAVAGTGYVGLSIATLLAQHHQVTAVDVTPEKVEKINHRISPIQDDERRPGPGGADAGLSTGKPAGAAEPAKRRASRRRAFLLRGARRFSRRAKHSFRFSRIGISRGSECHGERHHRPCQPVRLLGRAAADCRGEHFSADPQ